MSPKWGEDFMTLDELNIGEKALVKNICDDCSMKQRFIDIGIAPDTKIECVLLSPGKNPKAYMIKGAVIAIRSEDAKFINIERVE